MASSGNFMTFISSRASVTLDNGNTKATGDGGNFDNPYCNFAFDAEDTDGFYWEWRVGSSDDSTAYGISKAEVNDYTNTPNPTYGFYYDSDAGYAMQGNGNKRNGATNASYGGSSTSGNKVIGIAVRKGKIYFSIDGTFQNSGDPVNETGEAFSGLTGFWTPTFALNGSHNGILNAGQDSTFVGNETATTNSDANGFGEFHTAPPTGFKALCSGNVTTSSDIDPAQTDSDYPGEQFNVVTYTGNGSTQSITGLGFKPDLIWIKERSSGTSANHKLVDSNRGVHKAFESNSSGVEGDDTNGVTAFGTDGFSLGSDANYNQSSQTYVAWCWKCNGATTSSDSSGDITVTRQTNDAAKFSILTYTGNGSSAQTVGHGLGVEPDFIIAAPLDSSGSNKVSWIRGLTFSGSSSQFLKLNTDAAVATSGQFENVSSSLITIGGNANLSGKSTVLYCWANVEGFQRFGTYEGNSNADGTFVYTGFRPRMLFTKNIDGTGGWRVRDTARDTHNPSDTILWWDLSQQEYSNSAYSIDILSNGFKLRTSSGDFNASNTWAFGAWGDVPFKYNNAF